jgi:hypothetical protein
MKVPQRLLSAAILILVVSTPALSQPLVPPVAETVSLSGPRVGFTFLSPGIINKLKTQDAVSVGPVVSQFGWQFEKQFYGTQTGPTAVTECVALLGGLDQGVALPSLSWLVGIRTKDGAEFGLGPNVTPVGVALAIAAGITFRAGVLNVPVNLAVVPSKSGTRVSLLTGFSLRRQ